MNKIKIYYGPKAGFKDILPQQSPIMTISELAIYSDKKMREYKFLIQGRQTPGQEKKEERLHIPAVAAFSDQYAALSSSAILSFLSFLNQYEIDELYLQNPPADIVSQFENIESDITYLAYRYKLFDFTLLRRIDSEFPGVIIGQDAACRRLITALYPYASGRRDKPTVILFYGPTGVGKSETAKYLASVLGQRLFRKQFSMYHSSEYSSYLFGGRHTEASLAKDLMERESSVLLFDEFDKPNPVFHSAFYQLFDEGIYEDKNYSVRVDNSVIICTSNYAGEAEAREKLGAPLFARFDAVIGFDELSLESLEKILSKTCAEEVEELSEEDSGDFGAEDIYDALRPSLRLGESVREIQHTVKSEIAERLVARMLAAVS